MTLSKIALLFFGTKYTWAGNTAEHGFDCSGLVCECLRSVGELDDQDYSAQMLFDKFRDKLNYVITTDTILFFGKSLDNITHIAIALDTEFMIEAGGEGRTASDRGYVRIRPIMNRSDLIAALRL